MRAKRRSSCWAWNVAAFVVLASAALNSQTIPDESPLMQDWQRVAGGKMAFEVASVRLNKLDSVVKPNLALNTDDDPIPPGGRLVADFPLIVYISFAYKLPFTTQEMAAILAHEPRWVTSDHFVIEAKAPADATKDQMRLMMQSLLAERFKLKIHFETREMPVLAMVFAKPGVTGPRLRPHSEGLACGAKFTPPQEPSAPSVQPGGFIPECGAVAGTNGPNHTVLLGGRNVTMGAIASYLQTPSLYGRPVIDQTGMTGMFDFTLQWTPDNIAAEELDGQTQGDQAPDFIQAVREELGLKLVPRKAPVRTLAIDHIEMPTPN